MIVLERQSPKAFDVAPRNRRKNRSNDDSVSHILVVTQGVWRTGVISQNFISNFPDWRVAQNRRYGPAYQLPNSVCDGAWPGLRQVA
jgi:hypothetical protein